MIVVHWQSKDFHSFSYSAFSRYQNQYILVYLLPVHTVVVDMSLFTNFMKFSGIMALNFHIEWHKLAHPWLDLVQL